MKSKLLIALLLLASCRKQKPLPEPPPVKIWLVIPSDTTKN